MLHYAIQNIIQQFNKYTKHIPRLLTTHKVTVNDIFLGIGILKNSCG